MYTNMAAGTLVQTRAIMVGILKTICGGYESTDQ